MKNFKCHEIHTRWCVTVNLWLTKGIDEFFFFFPTCELLYARTHQRFLTQKKKKWEKHFKTCCIVKVYDYGWCFCYCSSSSLLAKDLHNCDNFFVLFFALFPHQLPNEIEIFLRELLTVQHARCIYRTYTLKNMCCCYCCCRCNIFIWKAMICICSGRGIIPPDFCIFNSTIIKSYVYSLDSLSLCTHVTLENASFPHAHLCTFVFICLLFHIVAYFQGGAGRHSCLFYMSLKYVYIYVWVCLCVLLS